ncbi:S-adenosyl-L-methionine-dependent methyltransferase [Glarea lozoyensis ATCC 20868]|uniref:2-methoxy-6-polyprenyl-1,4-benzoquinol methylase, mitochondrial n=1 Tax=Glarea lozoyensis (strain ATCC 20868 / MF5171) TaxID=1116229 RepID=S3D0A3_GLAL2|nr:S-adenosyl-L-methionine-dependent methyltransferase [Glarea lozoyensis ATCC 20868]EPE25491.1 S-adenosyl-L-methionine-dependent methyltransferase [Glarea lozoyensis ATCC 20868]
MATKSAIRPFLKASRFQCLNSRTSRYFSQTSIARSEPPQPTNHERTTHFGFETVAEAEKEARVAGVFSNVAQSYDTMNDFMSLGIHRLWKDHFVRSINPGTTTPSTTTTPSPGWKMLDIAGGTGDIAFRLLDHATNINNSPSSTITISDINPEMLEEGRKRSLKTSYANSPRLSFLLANAEILHTVPSNSVDLYTVAFGIRNFTDKPKALREAYRVLKPGGVFACLEFSGVTNPLFDAIYKRWSFGAIPLIGQLVAGDRASYQYLVESIEQFPKQEEFRDMIQEAGFVVPGKGWEDLTGGIAAIHKGVKPVPKQ